MPIPPSSTIARLLALGGELAPPASGEPRRKYDLAHMRILLDALGNPHRRFPSVLIAGTNGKGSTAATLASILQAAGHRTGLYTSPHLETANERIRINGVAISDEALAARFLQVEAASARLIAAGLLPYNPSFFETITAIAFLHFADASYQVSRNGELETPVQLAILEVGLGGRLDATNVVEPLLSVITDISLDHMQWLGSTLTEITKEKAGILRPQGVLVTLPQHPEVNQTIGEVAVPLEVTAINAADYLPPRSREPQAAPTLSAALRNRYSLAIPLASNQEINSQSGSQIEIDSPLSGMHQQRNIALAIASAIALHNRNGFALTSQAIETGVRRTEWPGRLQLLTPKLNQIKHAPVLLDAAHNPAGAWALRAVLSSLPAAEPRRLIFACMADKQVEEITQILFPVMDQVLLTTTGSPRSASIDQLEQAATKTGAKFQSYADPAAALTAAQAAAPPSGLIIVAGSISLLGAVTPLLSS